MREHKGWRHLFDSEGESFKSFEDFCVEGLPFGLGYDRQAIEGIITERKSVQQIAVEAKPLAKHGKIGNGRPATVERDNPEPVTDDAESRPYNIRSTQPDTTPCAAPVKYGTDPEYLASRIARDAPEILAKMKEGEYPSVRAAAIDAGMVKVATSLQKAQKVYLKLSESEKIAFWKWAEEERNTMD